MERFDFRGYRERKKKMRRWAYIIGGFAIINLLDVSFPFPIPLTGGPAVYVSLILLIPSLIVWLYTNQPPTDRMIAQLATKTNGYILATFLVSEFDIKTESAESVMKRLFLEGYLDIVNKVTNETPISQWITLFVGSSGERRSSEHTTEARHAGMDLAEHTVDNEEITVADINNMLLQGGLNLGSSGQPS